MCFSEGLQGGDRCCRDVTDAMLFHVLLIPQLVSVCLSLSKLMSTFATGSPQRAGVRDIEVNLPDGFPADLQSFSSIM